MQELIRIENITKKFGSKTVLKDVNISVKKREIYGIVGNNGAGKTTLLKIVCGMLKQTSGKIEFINKDKKNNLIGTLIESPGLFKDMTGFENLKAKALLLGARSSDEDINGLLKLVGLENTEKKSVRAYSMGMKQRLGIALALVGEPDLLILDEPINGLDPQGINEVHKIIMEIHRTRGVTMMISSHILDELAKTATRFCVIKDGTVIKECPTEQFLSECGDRDINEYYVELINKA